MIRHLPATTRTTFFVGAHPVRDALAVGMKLQAKASCRSALARDALAVGMKLQARASRASALLLGAVGLFEASRA